MCSTQAKVEGGGEEGEEENVCGSFKEPVHTTPPTQRKHNYLDEENVEFAEA